jgi:hypothetical protein
VHKFDAGGADEIAIFYDDDAYLANQNRVIKFNAAMEVLGVPK